MLQLKSISRPMLLACCFLLATPPARSNEPAKIALLVAIGDYPAEGGWQKINSQNDVALVENALLNQGFSKDQILVLTDANATRDGILDAIRSHLLGKAQRGGVAYFHFSGHGQQVADDNRDEHDGYDEAIVPINSPMNYKEGAYEGENLIRDDELGKLFKQIRERLGTEGSLLAVLDACHSGTGTRGFGIARGTTTKMASKTYAASQLSRGSDNTTMESFSEEDESRLAPMVAYFGAAHNQLNFETTDEEGRNVGSLSYAFSKKFAAASPSTSYRVLFEQIRLEMSAIAPRQQPQAEGSLDQEILGGSLLGAPTYFRVKSWNDPGSVVLEAGWLQGLREGSIVGLFAAGTNSPAGATPLATGTVSQADPTSCSLQLDANLDQESAESAWAFLLEQSFGDLQLSVKLALPEAHPAAAALENRLEKLPILRQEDSPELIVTTSASDGSARGAGAVQLVTNSDVVLETFSENLRPEILADRIVRQMMAYGQARFLKSMDLSSYELPVEFELVPVRYDHSQRKILEELSLSDKEDGSGTVRFQNGDVVIVKVTNNGYRPAYVTLLDIQPDNYINVLFPQPKETPAEYLVPAGQTMVVKHIFELKPPRGTEVFKLIATDEPVDLRPIATSRGEGKKSNPKAIERLFSQTFYNEDCMTRGGRTISVAAQEVNVASFTFIID